MHKLGSGSRDRNLKIVKMELKVLETCARHTEYSTHIRIGEITIDMKETKSIRAPRSDNVHTDFLLHGGTYKKIGPQSHCSSVK